MFRDFEIPIIVSALKKEKADLDESLIYGDSDDGSGRGHSLLLGNLINRLEKIKLIEKEMHENKYEKVIWLSGEYDICVRVIQARKNYDPLADWGPVSVSLHVFSDDYYGRIVELCEEQVLEVSQMLVEANTIFLELNQRSEKQ